MEDGAGFRVARRLIGPGGENVRRIARECPGVRVELRGAGIHPVRGDEESGPLVLHIKGRDPAQCARAVELANVLIAETAEERARFVARARPEAAPQRKQAGQEWLERPGGAAGKGTGEAGKAGAGYGGSEHHRLSAPCSQEESTSADGSAPGTECDAPDSEAEEASLEPQEALRGSGPELVAGAAGRGQRARPAAAAAGPGEEAGDTEAADAWQQPRPRGGGSGSSRGDPATPGGQSHRSAPPVHLELEVGLADSPKFRVVRRLLGPGGENMKYIVAECPGTRIQLRGAGTNPWMGSQSGPLVFHVKGHDRAQCEAALGIAAELVDHVREEHRQLLEAEDGAGGGD